jgi:hypothetical protein
MGRARTETALSITAMLVVIAVAGCSGSSPSPSQSGSTTPSEAQLIQACREAAKASSPEKLTLAVAQSLAGKPVVACEVKTKDSSFVLHTIAAEHTATSPWAAYATPGEPMPAECRVSTTSTFYVYVGSAFLLARDVECSYGAGASPS